MPRNKNIKIRRGTKEVWDFVNPVLDVGELGFDTTQNLIKIGNGSDSWHDLLILAQANPLLLSENALFTNKISIRSPIIDFTSADDVEIMTVPSGYMFSIDSMEVMTISIANPGLPPKVRFGNGTDYDAYHPSSSLYDSAPGARHIIGSPQNSAIAGTVVTFGVSEASGADEHTGCSLISGHLVKIN